MVSLENFLNDYNGVLVWVFSVLIFLGFLKGLFTVLKAIWKYFKRGVYDL